MILLITTAALAATLVGHALVSRVLVASGRVLTFVGVAGLIGALLAAGLIWTHGLTAETISSLLLYSFGCELYLFLVTFTFSSISANILTKLLGGPIALSDIETGYSGLGMAAQRADRIEQAGLVEVRKGLLHLTSRGKLVVAIIFALRSVFGHDKIANS
jgi:hypothetical protein